MIPKFETPDEAIKWLHIPKRRKCGSCKQKKEQDNGNSFFCNACLIKNKARQVELKKSQAYYRLHPELIPK